MPERLHIVNLNPEKDSIICHKCKSDKYYQVNTYIFCSVCDELISPVINPVVNEFGEYIPSSGSPDSFQHIYELLDVNTIKDDNGNCVFDTSNDNINNYGQLFKEHPNNIYTFISYLFLKIFASRDYSDLIPILLKYWKKGEFSVSEFFLTFEVEISERNTFCWEKIYFEQMRNFLLGLMDIDLEGFRKDFSKEYLSGGVSLKSLIKFLGVSILPDIINKNSFIIFKEDIDFGSGYEIIYLLAEEYYRNEKWMDAFYLFEKLMIINDINKVNDELLISYFNGDSNFKSLFTNYNIAVKNIKDRAYNSFLKAIKNGYVDEIYEFINALSEADYKLKEQKKLTYPYEELTSIFANVVNGNFVDAYEKWIGLSQKIKISVISDNQITTIYLKNLKNNKGDLNSFFSENPIMKDVFLIYNFHKNMRTFLTKNLTNYYGEKDWRDKGIPGKVKVNIKRSSIKYGNSNSDSEPIDYDFDDYYEIISHNWKTIFKEYFPPSVFPYEFLDSLRKYRNIVFHAFDLSNDQRKKFIKCINVFNIVYNSWDNTRNK